MKLHVHFLTSSVMNISFEKLQTLLTYRRKYVRFYMFVLSHTHSLITHRYFQVRACVGNALVTHDDGLQICELVRRRTSTKKRWNSKSHFRVSNDKNARSNCGSLMFGKDVRYRHGNRTLESIARFFYHDGILNPTSCSSGSHNVCKSKRFEVLVRTSAQHY